MGVTERSDETVEMLADDVCNILYEKAGVEIKQRDIVAIYWITGKAGMPIHAQRIRISEILPKDRKSNLNHAILPRTSSNVIM